MSKPASIKVRGWLLTFLIIFVLVAIGFATLFVNALNKDVEVTDRGLQLILNPIIAVTLLVSVVLAWQHRKAALMFIYFSLGAMAVYTVIQAVITEKDVSPEMRVGSVVSGLVVYGLWALYFKRSRRVKDTLKK